MKRKHQRNHAILRMLQDPLIPYRVIAAKYGITIARVGQIRRLYGAPGRRYGKEKI
jgi:hypothetical protein